MSESFGFESFLNLEQSVIEALNGGGIEDLRSKELLGRYADQCQAEANLEVASNPESSEASNRANIKAGIKLAILYSKTEKYKAQAREALEETLWAAQQNESTLDLAREIEELLLNLET